MVAFKYILALLSTASALIVERNVNTVLNNLKAIDTSVNKLNQDIKSWNGQLSGSLIIQSDENSVEKNFNSTTEELQTEAGLSSADQGTLANYFTGTLEGDYKAAINTTVSRKSDFIAAGLGPTIKQDLQRLYNELKAFCKAFLGVVASPQPNAACKSACEQLYTAVSSAAASFS